MFSLLCLTHTSLPPSPPSNVARQIHDYLAPHKAAAAAASRAAAASTSSSSRLVDLTVTARADGVRIRDRLLWDVASPASSIAAYAAATAADVGLGCDAAAALEAALRDAVAKARAGDGGGVRVAGVDRGDDAGAWGPRVEEDKGGWDDAD